MVVTFGHVFLAPPLDNLDPPLEFIILGIYRTDSLRFKQENSMHSFSEYMSLMDQF